jgi:tetratricopeptide (TPR) repeat protein
MYLYNPLCEYLFTEFYCRDYEKTFIEICDSNINISGEFEVMRTYLYRGMYYFGVHEFEKAYKDFKIMKEMSEEPWNKYKACYWIAFTLGALEWDEQIFLELPEIIREFPDESETPLIKKEYASAQIRYGYKTNNIDLINKGRELLEEILSKPNYMVKWFKDEFVFYIAKSYDYEYKITGNSASVEKAIEKYKEYFNVAEENYSYGYYDNALNNIAEIEIKAGNFDKAAEYLKKALNRNGVISEFDYYENDYENLIDDIRSNLEKCFSIKINPVIEEMEEGDHQLLTAELKDKYGNSLENGTYNIVEWKWKAVGSQDTEYELTVSEQSSDKADLYLKKGNFMDIIVTAECNFELLSENNRGDIFISKVIAVEGDNQVPIMIVNEDDRRIKNIPMINPHNLEGVGMGERCLKTILFSKCI